MELLFWTKIIGLLLKKKIIFYRLLQSYLKNVWIFICESTVFTLNTSLWTHLMAKIVNYCNKWRDFTLYQYEILQILSKSRKKIKHHILFRTIFYTLFINLHTWIIIYNMTLIVNFNHKTTIWIITLGWVINNFGCS